MLCCIEVFERSSCGKNLHRCLKRMTWCCIARLCKSSLRGANSSKWLVHDCVCTGVITSVTDRWTGMIYLVNIILFKVTGLLDWWWSDWLTRSFQFAWLAFNWYSAFRIPDLGKQATVSKESQHEITLTTPPHVYLKERDRAAHSDRFFIGKILKRYTSPYCRSK